MFDSSILTVWGDSLACFASHGAKGIVFYLLENTLQLLYLFSVRSCLLFVKSDACRAKHLNNNVFISLCRCSHSTSALHSFLSEASIRMVAR